MRSRRLRRDSNAGTAPLPFVNLPTPGCCSGWISTSNATAASTPYVHLNDLSGKEYCMMLLQLRDCDFHYRANEQGSRYLGTRAAAREVTPNIDIFSVLPLRTFQ